MITNLQFSHISMYVCDTITLHVMHALIQIYISIFFLFSFFIIATYILILFLNYILYAEYVYTYLWTALKVSQYFYVYND